MKKKVIFLIVIVVLAIITLYFTFLYTKKCSDVSCFNTALSSCRRASYTNDAEDATWLYAIKGKSNGECKINVEILQLKQGTIDISNLEGKSMVCYVPSGSITAPQENLEKCHGLLKEEMQKIIINRLHSYIVGNIGEISEELNKAI